MNDLGDRELFDRMLAFCDAVQQFALPVRQRVPFAREKACVKLPHDGVYRDRRVRGSAFM